MAPCCVHAWGPQPHLTAWGSQPTWHLYAFCLITALPAPPPHLAAYLPNSYRAFWSYLAPMPAYKAVLTRTSNAVRVQVIAAQWSPLGSTTPASAKTSIVRSVGRRWSAG